MLNNRIERQKEKQKRYEALARVSKIFSSPRRLEIMDALVQKPSAVEEIAKATGQSIATTSQHLQILKRSHVVMTERIGTTIIYSLHARVMEIFVQLRSVAEELSPELLLLKQQKNESIELLCFEQVQQLLAKKEAVLVDVRSQNEFDVKHIAQAISIPLQQLEQRSSEIPLDKKIIITCRGPYCVSSEEAVELLQKKGFQVYRYDDGVGEWQYHGGKTISNI